MLNIKTEHFVFDVRYFKIRNIDIIMLRLEVIMSLKTFIVIRKTSAGLSCTSFEEKHAFK